MSITGYLPSPKAAITTLLIMAAVAYLKRSGNTLAVSYL